MPCYFVSSGVEMSMTDETFDFIWNSFGNKELTDSETSSLSEEGDKRGSFVDNAKNAEWRKQDDDTTTENQTTRRISKDITKRKRSNLAYARYAVLP